MNISRTFLHTLNVRREEWWLVRKLFNLQFFQGAGIAFFYTTASVKFLHTFPITDLAYLYILSAAMLWLAGLGYSRFEHLFGIAKISLIITILMAVSMLVFWLAAETIHSAWFYYGIMAWFHVLYLLNNLTFWGLASQLYDVRQSKRLFSVISAGDIPAKFIGYTAALLIVSYIGINNLLFVGFACILISIPYLLTVLRSSKEELHHQPHKHEKHDTKVGLILKDYTVNKLVRKVAVLSLLVSVSIILLNYSFYAEIKETKTNDVALAFFIALFQALGSLTALVTKAIFSSRIVQRLGNAKALILTPVVLIGFMILLLTVGRSTGNNDTILYIFGFTYIVVDVLRASINSPILLALMQPLSTTQRLRAHNIVKGFMDPFAYLLCGVFLLFLFQKEWYNLYSLSYVLMALAAGWIINIIMVNKQYLKALITTISSRYFSQEEFDLSNRETQKMVEQKIGSGTELEVFYILNMLSTRKTSENEPLILKALEHPSSKVVIEALKLVNDQKIIAAMPLVQALIISHPDVHVKSNAIKTLAESGADNTIISGFLYQSDKELQQAAIIAVINYGKTAAKYGEAVTLLAALAESPRIAENKEALLILSQLKGEGFEDETLELLNRDNPEIKVEAIRAIGLNPTEKTLTPLFDWLPGYEKEVLNSLHKADVLSLPLIKKNLLETSLTDKQKLNLIALCGRMEGIRVQKMLFSLLIELPQFHSAIIRALQKCQYKASLEEKKKIEELVRLYLVIAAEILHMHKRIYVKKDVYHLLHDSLQIELDDIKVTLLCLFSFLYDSNQINKIRSALAKKATLANGMELVDMTVRKDFARPFTVIFDSGDIEHRCKALKDLFPRELFPEVKHILHNILYDQRFSYNHWTMACSLYTSKKQHHELDKSLIRKYIGSEIRLLKETAEFAL